MFIVVFTCLINLCIFYIVENAYYKYCTSCISLQHFFKSAYAFTDLDRYSSKMVLTVVYNVVLYCFMLKC